jgi:uncharacterized protein YqjF (DUF2071 family)
MYQSWGSLLFIHWTVEPEFIAKHLPEGLTVDTFDGKAFVAITPFTLWNVRPIFVPPLPYFSEFHELNIRTYVHHDGVPGVYFFSLDANRMLPVIGARNLYHLPYKQAEIELHREDRTVTYKLRRTDEPVGELSCRWTEMGEDTTAAPGSLEFFLTERYCLYAEQGDDLYRSRIHHEPWPLREARLEHLHTTLFEADGLETPPGEPFVMAGGPVNVEVWPIHKVSDRQQP